MAFMVFMAAQLYRYTMEEHNSGNDGGLESTECESLQARWYAGQIVFEGELPEGADVTLIADDHEVGFEVDAELKAVLLQAIVECDLGEKISAHELLRELSDSRGYGPPI
jgi:hypothetical protein